VATVNLWGPYFWVQPSGQNGLLPGEAHNWVFTGLLDLVYAVSAHPSRDYNLQALAVTDMSTVYARTGPPELHVTVRNVGTSGVLSYRMFLTETNF
jgi:hypothetical protein